MSSRATLAVSTALALVALGGTSALADQSRYATEFKRFALETSTTGSESFSGKIDSRRAGCRGNRHVKLYRKRHGDRQPLGGDDTGGQGRFEIAIADSPLKPGRYIAIAPEVSFRSDSGHKVTCAEGKSPIAEVD